MPIFAVIENQQIKNVIVAETVEIAEEATNSLCVELPETGFGIGDLYDGTSFIRHPEPEVTE